MSEIIVFNKPFQVLTQFTDSQGRPTLGNYIKRKGVYAAGRLDYDSEGLLILTDNGQLQHKLADPRFKLEKTYWAQVEGEISDEALQQLRQGVTLKDGVTRPAKARKISEPAIWPRTPPIRERQNQPTSWVELKISEGKNRQVRRMTAAVGFPTLRLIRAAIGNWTLEQLKPGEYRTEEVVMPAAPRQPRTTKPSSSRTPHARRSDKATTHGRKARSKPARKQR